MRFFRLFIISLLTQSLIFTPQAFAGSQLDIVRSSMKDLGLYSNRQRPKIANVYKAAREGLKPKAQKWMDPVIDSLANFPVFEMTSKVTRSREGLEVFRFTIKDPTGDVTMDITPSSEYQPIKINGVPMPVAAWWSEKDFENFLDLVMKDGEISKNEDLRNKFSLFAKLILGAHAQASEADDLWLEITSRACLNILDAADTRCDNTTGTMAVFGQADSKVLHDKLSDAKKNILAERSKDAKEYKRLGDLVKDRIEKLEKSFQKVAKLPEKKIEAAAPPPPPAPKPVAAEPPPVKVEKAPERKVASIPAPAHKKTEHKKKPKVIALDFNADDYDPSIEDVGLSPGKIKLNPRTTASLPTDNDIEASEAASEVPSPNVDLPAQASQVRADDTGKSIAQRRDSLSAKKIGLMIVAVTGMALLTKIIARETKAAPSLKVPPIAAPTGPAVIPQTSDREPASTNAVVSEPLTAEELLTPVKPRKTRGTN